MINFVRSGFNCTLKELEIKYEISDVLNEIITDIEVWDRENSLISVLNDLQKVSFYFFFQWFMFFKLLFF